VREFTHEALHELAHLDGKIFQTARMLLFKPGALTIEFLAGRRARYVSPIRLYLICSLLFFGVLALAPQKAFEVTARDKREAGEENLKNTERTLHDVGERLTHNTARGMFVLMPAFGALTWIFYRRAQPYYIPHLYYSINVHSFGFLLLAVAQVCEFAGPYGDLLAKTLRTVLVPYHYVALHRVFGGTKVQTAWKGTLIGVLYLILLAAVLFVVLIYVVQTTA
jgi:hypothetical protein